MIKKTAAITNESFDTLLTWLDGNREGAAQKYEKIRWRLIRIFAGRGCFEAEDLADETINRVMLKLPQIINTYLGDQALYFYGVADNIYHEWLRQQKKIQNVQPADVEVRSKIEEPDFEYECLESCLDALPTTERRLITEYYREEKSAKIENRRSLADALGISINALQVKTSRIRSGLKKCLQNCLAEKAA